VGQPTKFCELYSNQSAAVVVGMTGRLAATYFYSGTRSAVCCATVLAELSVASADSTVGSLSRS
jgi:hypothetical protein